MPNTLTIDSALWILSLMLLLGVVGFLRGARAEAATLVGVIVTAIIFGSNLIREGITVIINRLPKIIEVLTNPDGPVAAMGTKKGTGLLQTDDQKLFFYVALFVLGILLSYFVGNRLRDSSREKTQKLAGGVMGALSGFAISLAFANFSQNYLSRHPDFILEIQVPPIVVPALSGINTLTQYTLPFFAGGFLAVGLFVLVSAIRARL